MLTTDQIDAIRDQFKPDDMPSRATVQRIAELLAASAPTPSAPTAPAQGEPVAWVRKHPDSGELSGDWLWDDVIEQCRKDSGVWFPLGFLFAPQAPSVSIPDGWMLVPKHRGTKPLAELIIAASLACVENRLMDGDDRHELAQFADQLQHAGQPSPAVAKEGMTEERAACIAPACHQWDGNDSCTCQTRAVLERVATALPVLRTMLTKEGLAGAEIADEFLADIRALLGAKGE